MAATTPTSLGARIDLSALLEKAEGLFPSYHKYIDDQLELFDPEDGAEPDEDRYDDIVEDSNDISTLSASIVPSLSAKSDARAEEAGDPEIGKWKAQTVVHSLFDLSPLNGGKAPRIVEKAVAWYRSRSPDPSDIAQMDFL